MKEIGLILRNLEQLLELLKPSAKKKYNRKMKGILYIGIISRAQFCVILSYFCREAKVFEKEVKPCK